MPSHQHTRFAWVHVKVVGKNKSFKEREKDGILFGETKV
jgi:hypothetical protein